MVRRAAEAGGERRGEAGRQGEARRRRRRQAESGGAGGGDIRSKTGRVRQIQYIQRIRSKLPVMV